MDYGTAKYLHYTAIKLSAYYNNYQHLESTRTCLPADVQDGANTVHRVMGERWITKQLTGVSLNA